MPLVASTTSLPDRSLSMPAGPRRAICSTRALRRFDLADAEARSAIRSWNQPTIARAEDHRQQQRHLGTDRRQSLVMDHHIRDGAGDEPGLGDQEPGGDAAEDDGYHQKPPGPAGVVEQPSVDGAAPVAHPHPSRSVRCSPTRMALAMAVRAGLTAPMLGKKLVSTT